MVAPEQAAPLPAGNGMAASTAGRAQAAIAPAVAAEGIAKNFGVTRAVVDCTVDVRPGEVHVLIGENGSGKSTLVKILSGVHRPDAGTISIGGERHHFLASPRQATDVGIVTVFQEILVAPQRSVLANAWLGADRLVRRGDAGDDRRLRARQLLGRLVDSPELDRPAGELGLNDRQALCIVRALLRRPRMLILDESTSALDISTRDNLFAIISELCESGVGVLFISHRMDEVERIADRVTVMRSGRNVSTTDRGQLSTAELVSLMIGSDQVVDSDRPSRHRSTDVQHAPTLRARDIRLRGSARAFDAEFHAGELVGLAGLEGHGQDDFLRRLSGAGSGGGRVTAIGPDGQRTVSSRVAALDAGIAYVPRDRRTEALFPTLSVLENFGVATTRADRRVGLVSRRATRERFAQYIGRLRILAPQPGGAITALSGGNQQKVILARCLAANPNVLLLNDPTRGVDLGAKADIYTALADATTQGMTVIMLSTELIELVELMDRVLVFREGELFRELQRDEITRTNLVAGYFGRDGG
jgi:ABC-type sugar transport system ATPase subunit